jgi:hypothetical protein
MVGPWFTTYHHGGSYWEQTSKAHDLRARELTPKPDTGLEDTTNYLVAGEKHLSPGVRLEGKHMATTCGVHLRNSRGDTRITAANQGFAAADDDEIWHPHSNDSNGDPIGIIKERYEAEDVALWEPVGDLPFNSATYFAAESPRQLQKCADITLGSWCEADGMSTGKVVFQCIGIESDFPQRLQGAGKIKYVDLKHHSTWAVLGAVGSKALARGICGAPIVGIPCPLRGLAGGGVVGFFHLHGDETGICSTPAVDHLIEKGWSIF